MAESSEKAASATRGSIFLHPLIWKEIEELAAANGIQLKEQLRICAIEGLRAQQKRHFEATGVYVGEDAQQ